MISAAVGKGSVHQTVRGQVLGKASLAEKWREVAVLDLIDTSLFFPPKEGSIKSVRFMWGV